MKFLQLLLSFLLMACLAAAIPLDQGLSTRAIILPSNDPFYTPDEGYESQPVGTILRSRILNNQVGILVFAAKVKTTYQFLVRSEDTHGNANAIVTTVFAPFNADPKKILSFQVAEDSASINCSPSYAFQLGANIDTAITSQIEQAFMYAPLEQGWYVVSPDYEGPTSAYTVGKQAGKATLNSIRAALSSGNYTGISPDAKVAYWGYSGGSSATGWAALLEPTYAPDLKDNTVGYAYGGIIVSIENTARKNIGTIFAGLVFAAINGLSSQYPKLDEYIVQQVTPSKLNAFRRAKNMCLVELFPTYLFNSWKTYIPIGGAVLDDPIVQEVLTDNDMIKSTLVPTAPLFFYNSKFDEILPAADADLLYTRLCAAGATINYRQDLIGGHGTQYVFGGGSAWTWIQDRMSGKPVSGCHKSVTLSNILTPGGIPGFSSIVSGLIKAILGKPLGQFNIF